MSGAEVEELVSCGEAARALFHGFWRGNAMNSDDFVTLAAAVDNDRRLYLGFYHAIVQLVPNRKQNSAYVLLSLWARNLVQEHRRALDVSFRAGVAEGRRQAEAEAALSIGDGDAAVSALVSH